MTGLEILLLGRKAESIYTAKKRNCLECKKKNAVSTTKNSTDSFEEYFKRNAASKACYVYINGVSMPVLSA